MLNEQDHNYLNVATAVNALLIAFAKRCYPRHVCKNTLYIEIKQSKQILIYTPI